MPAFQYSASPIRCHLATLKRHLVIVTSDLQANAVSSRTTPASVHVPMARCGGKYLGNAIFFRATVFRAWNTNCLDFLARSESHQLLCDLFICGLKGTVGALRLKRGCWRMVVSLMVASCMLQSLRSAVLWRFEATGVACIYSPPTHSPSEVVSFNAATVPMPFRWRAAVARLETMQRHLVRRSGVTGNAVMSAMEKSGWLGGNWWWVGWGGWVGRGEWALFFLA